jgi:hypothetical protein
LGANGAAVTAGVIGPCYRLLLGTPAMGFVWFSLTERLIMIIGKKLDIPIQEIRQDIRILTEEELDSQSAGDATGEPSPRDFNPKVIEGLLDAIQRNQP